MDKGKAKVAVELAGVTAELEGLKEEQAELMSDHENLEAENNKLKEENSRLKKYNARLIEENYEVEMDTSALAINRNDLARELKMLEWKVEEKKSLLRKLEEKISTLLASVKYKVNGYINERAVRNTQKRLEETLGQMPYNSAYYFRKNWDMLGDKYPCFNLKYVKQYSWGDEEKLSAIPQDLKDSYLSDIKEFVEEEDWDLSL